MGQGQRMPEAVPLSQSVQGNHVAAMELAGWNLTLAACCF